MVLHKYRVFFLVFISFLSEYAFSQCPDDPSFNYNGGQLNFDQLDANVLPTIASSGEHLPLPKLAVCTKIHKDFNGDK